MQTRITRKSDRLCGASVTLIALLVLCLTCTSNLQLGNSIAGENRAIAKPGGFQLLVYDAPPPGNIDEINLTVVSVDVVKQDGGIINISDKPRTFNLLNYREGNPLELANKVIPSGRYSEIRLKLNEDNSIVVSGQTKSLKTPSAQQSGVKLKGHFEIVEGLLYTMRLHFDPNKSVVYNPGPDRYILKPVIEIAGNSLVDGPFTVTGLIENETVVAELKPDGTLKLIGSFDPRIEISGLYYFNFGTRLLRLELTGIICETCNGAQSIPNAVFYNLPNTNIKISRWDSANIVGSVGSGLLSRQVTFRKANSYSFNFPSTYSTVKITIDYPSTLYDGKYGLLALTPKTVPGRSFADVQKIENKSATFTLKIPYSELPGTLTTGRKDFIVRPMVAAALTDFQMSVQSPASICGNVQLSTANYTLSIPVADKVLSTSLAFAQDR